MDSKTAATESSTLPMPPPTTGEGSSAAQIDAPTAMPTSASEDGSAPSAGQTTTAEGGAAAAGETTGKKKRGRAPKGGVKADKPKKPKAEKKAGGAAKKPSTKKTSTGGGSSSSGDSAKKKKTLELTEEQVLEGVSRPAMRRLSKQPDGSKKIRLAEDATESIRRVYGKIVQQLAHACADQIEKAKSGMVKLYDARAATNAVLPHNRTWVRDAPSASA